MKRVINGLRLAACIAVVVLLFTTTSGCLGGVISQPYSVSGKITDPDGNGIGGVAIAFSGRFGTATTSDDGKWAKDGLKGKVTVTPTKEGWKFTPGSKTVSKEASNVDFVGSKLDYLGLFEFSEWNYNVTIEPPPEDELNELYVSVAVDSVEECEDGTYFYISLEGSEVAPAYHVLTGQPEPPEEEVMLAIARKEDGYYLVIQVEGQESIEAFLFEAPLEAGDTIMGELLTVEGEESIATPTGTFKALRCALAGSDEDDVERITFWLAPYIGLVKAEIVNSPYPGDEDSEAATLTIILESYAAQ